MPESVDIFEDHLDIPELESGFINQYNIEGNIPMIQAFYPKTKHIAFISDNTYGGVTMQALVRKEMKKFPDLDLILMDGRRHSIYTIVEELRQLPENTVILVGTWRVDMNEGYFMRNATYAMMGSYPYHSGFYPFIGESWLLGDRRSAARLSESGRRNGYGVRTDGSAPGGYGEASFDHWL